MKTPERICWRPRTVWCALWMGVLIAPVAFPAQLQEARVTQVVKEVKLLRAQAAPRPAAMSDTVSGDTSVQTGTDSRAELTFIDQTLTRLGANTLFTFDRGTRTLDLGSGAMLLYVPKNAGGAKVVTAAVTAAITGTTCLVESHRKGLSKLILLEGSGRAFLKRDPSQSVLMHPGEMLAVPWNATKLPEPRKIDLRVLRETSGLLFPPLPSEGLMQAEEDKQNEGSPPKHFVVDPTSHDVIDQKTNARPRRPGTPGLPGGP